MSCFGQDTIKDQDEAIVLHSLIKATKRNLVAQKKLLKNLVEYKKSKIIFMKNPQAKKEGAEMVKAAMLLHREINKTRLSYLFSEKFLKEIDFFNEVGEECFLARKNP